MNIAFYAPLKSPNDPVPSGDRQIARNIVEALTASDCSIDLVSARRTYEGAGDRARQSKIQEQAISEAERLIATYAAGKARRPDIWLTYHSYHKAPDWIGPKVASALQRPYCVLEASISPKQANGRWASGHAQACHVVAVADLIFGLNPRDRKCVEPTMKPDANYVYLPPFVKTQVLSQDTASESSCRRIAIAAQHNIDKEKPWLLAVGMMRSGDKFRSYEQLAAALDHLPDQPWQLVCVGDGPERENTQALFQKHTNRIAWLGALPAEELPQIYGCADLLVWPAVNEALGMTFLEAAACGLTSVAGHTDGVASLINHNETGLIAPAGDVAAFAESVRTLLEYPDRRHELARAARRNVEEKHSLEAAAGTLKNHLQNAIRRRTEDAAS